MIGPCAGIAAKISSGLLDGCFVTLYGADSVVYQKKRYLRLLEQLETGISKAEGVVISAPGRTELGGNHTDHNGGRVLAAAVDLDCVAAVSPIASSEVILISDGYHRDIRVKLKDLTPHKDEEGTPEALVRGVAAAFASRGHRLNGFQGYLHSTCQPGTGLSSSAAFAVLVGAAFNFLYHGCSIGAETLAHMAGEAENKHFGKPCGLMDQMSSAVGGTLAIDFQKPEKPVIERITESISTSGYRLVVVDTGGSHVKLTPEYTAIPEEMKEAARILGYQTGRGLSIDALLKRLPEVRRTAGDRAALRLLHFIEENDRVPLQVAALREGRLFDYLEYVAQSGESSALLLQNCASLSTTREQGILLALALSRRTSPRSVSRVHGGGFAGTIQAYIPEDTIEDYIHFMENIFGRGAVIPLIFGRPGVCSMTESGLVFPKTGS